MISRSGTKGESVDMVFTVRGTAEFGAAVTAVEAESPESFEGLFRQNPKVEPEFVDTCNPETSIWTATISYRPPSYSKPQQTVVAVGSRRLDIDTTGGTRHITQGLGSNNGVIWRFPSSISDLGGAIGDDGKLNVTGVDVSAPSCKITVTDARLSASSMYLKDAYKLNSCVNSSSLTLSDDYISLTFDAGEVLYLGYTLRRRTDGIELVHQFDCMPNQAQQVIGAITIPAKDAWDYLWFQYEPVTDGSRFFMYPLAAYINRVYRRGNLNVLGLGNA